MTSEEFKSNVKKRLTKRQSLYLEEHADMNTLSMLMQQSLDGARIQIENHNRSPSLTVRFGRKVADISYTLNGFINAYAGIVEVMKQSTSRYDYGNVAYQTMSLFLVVSFTASRNCKS